MKLEMKSEIPPRVVELDRQARKVAKQYDHCEKELVSIFEEFGQSKGYLFYDCNSLYEYGIKELKLSEASVSNISAVASKTLKFPELKEAIMQGDLTVSKARKITPVLNEQNTAVWVELAKTSTVREIEKAVATEKPEQLVRETVKYKAAGRLEFKCGISEELSKKLERIKDLESQRTSSVANFEAALEAMAEAYFEKHDPIRKAERSVKRAEKKSQKLDAPSPKICHVTEATALISTTLAEDTKPTKNSIQKISIMYRREAVPAVMKHAVTLRDLRRCTHLYSDGTRCECTRWLDVHHIIPISEGGKNEISNLTTMCRTHHQMLHRH